MPSVQPWVCSGQQVSLEKLQRIETGFRVPGLELSSASRLQELVAGILSTAPRSPWLLAEPSPWVSRESSSALISGGGAPSRILTFRVAVMDSHSLQKDPVTVVES